MSKTAPALTKGTSYRVPALAKGLDVLELLAESSAPRGLSDIAAGLGRSRQELFRVINALHEHGYLLRDRAQRYRLSTKLFELGSRAASTQALSARAMPHMERLAESLGETCHLNIVVGRRMLVLAQAQSQADVSLSVRVGASFELHRRNTGRLALAYWSPAQREEYWHASGQSQQTFAGWDAELETIRQRGYEVAASPITVGVTDCTAPVLGVGEQLLAVLCVSHIERVDEITSRDHIAEMVVRCAAAISREFGSGANHNAE